LNAVYVRSAATAATLVVGALALAHAGSALAAAPLEFSGAQGIDSHPPLSTVACVSEARCLAVDGKGFLLASTNAAAGAWSGPVQIDGELALTSISCTPDGLCVAGDAAGALLASGNSGQTWSRQPTGEGEIRSVSCASRSLCAAVTAGGEVLASGDPAAASPTWTAVAVEHVGLRAVSCTGSLCVAVGGGYVAAGSEPLRQHSWSTPRALDAQLDMSAISCTGAEACVAVDESGEVLASADAARPYATWSSTAVNVLDDLDGVSCSSGGLCLAVGTHGEALAADDATDVATPEWNEYRPTGAGELVGVACLQGGLCVTANAAGQALTARVGAPSASTAAPGTVTSTSATLGGQLDANGAAITSCAFEYGTTSAYGSSAPCAEEPAAAAGAQPVSAAIAGLSPNTTYHYRLAAASARGAGLGADVAFTTAISSAVPLVHPHPSITGTPAVGSTLTCESGVGPGSGAATGYQWLRNTVAIPSATASSYTVRGADNGAHLQCLLTATDGGGSASATSAFVNVPYQAPPAANGETAVGRALQLGEKITVPVTCAADASRGCRIVLRASTRRSGRTSALAAAGASLPAGRGAAIALSLGRSARRLLAARGRLAVALSVSGTVIGVIEAQLSQQTLELTQTAARAKKSARGLVEAAPLRRAWARAAHASLAAARPASTLSPTPYMGWDSYFTFGGDYDESSILEQASQLIALGLAREGYRYVWLDVGWWRGAREASGAIAVNRSQWPHGMRWLAATLHAAGLRVGLYTDAGANGCGGTREGAYGHYQQDVDTFAAWGFDAVKVDFCGGAEMHLNPAAAYGSFHDAIAHNSSHRQMLLDVCDFLQPDQYSESQPTLSESAFASYEFGPAVANSWRTDTDVGAPHDVSFANVLRNMDADAAAPQAAGPGHWNDPDYLGPDQGLSAAQFRTQFSMWSILAAPLMISDNLATISAASLETVRRAAVIAVDQDPAGLQGTLLSSSGEGQVWVKPLAGGARAVALLNRGGSPLRIATSAGALALPAGPPYRVRNLWSGALFTTAGGISAEVPAQSTVLLLVTAT
jgi:hypothetical protein